MWGKTLLKLLLYQNTINISLKTHCRPCPKKCLQLTWTLLASFFICSEKDLQLLTTLDTGNSVMVTSNHHLILDSSHFTKEKKPKKQRPSRVKSQSRHSNLCLLQVNFDYPELTFGIWIVRPLTLLTWFWQWSIDKSQHLSPDNSLLFNLRLCNLWTLNKPPEG